MAAQRSKWLLQKLSRDPVRLKQSYIEHWKHWNITSYLSVAVRPDKSTLSFHKLWLFSIVKARPSEKDSHVAPIKLDHRRRESKPLPTTSKVVYYP